MRAPRQTQKLRIRPAQEKGKREAVAASQRGTKAGETSSEGQGENVVVQKGVFSFSSAGIDNMTIWTAAVPADPKKNPFAPPKERRKREAER